MEQNDANDDRERAVGLLQQLGLKEYEAKCLVALSRVAKASAKEISEWSDVPRTRVYDATRVLAAQGLVEVQHGSPQQFRAVPLEEAVETLRDQYEDRIETLQESLEELDSPEQAGGDPVNEVWSLSDTTAIANRTEQLIETAEEEVVLVLGVEGLVTESLVDSLNSAVEAGASVLVGALDAEIQDRIDREVEGAEAFVSELEWLHGSNHGEQDVAIGRLLLVDRQKLLASSFDPHSGHERAVFGVGFSNGLVVVARRLMATGLITPTSAAN